MNTYVNLNYNNKLTASLYILDLDNYVSECDNFIKYFLTDELVKELPQNQFSYIIRISSSSGI